MSLRGPTDPNLTPFNSSSLSQQMKSALWRGLWSGLFHFKCQKLPRKKLRFYQQVCWQDNGKVHSTEGRPAGTWAVSGPERPGLGTITAGKRPLVPQNSHTPPATCLRGAVGCPPRPQQKFLGTIMNGQLGAHPISKTLVASSTGGDCYLNLEEVKVGSGLTEFRRRC